jgi:hypothetical protein
VVEHSLGKGEATRSIRVKSTKEFGKKRTPTFFQRSFRLSELKIAGEARQFLGLGKTVNQKINRIPHC